MRRVGVRGGRAVAGLAAVGAVAWLAIAPPAVAVSPEDPLGLESRLADPPRVHRPNVFWWWPGSEVTEREIGADIEALKEAGFGAAQVIDLEGGPVQGGGLDWQWGTPKWFAAVNAAMAKGIEAGVRIDGAQYPVWSMSSRVASDNLDLASQALHYGQRDLHGPIQFAGPPPDAAAVIGAKKLVAVTAARPLPGHDRVLDPKTAIDLTANVGHDGLLRWSVPPGRWKLFGFWRRPTGQVPQTMGGVIRLLTLDQARPRGYPNDLLVIDHFSTEAAQAALDWIDRHVPPGTDELRHANGGELYEDSLELSTGLGSGLFWSPRFLEEFRARRGYDLTPLLPVLFFPMQHTVIPPLDLFEIPLLDDLPVPKPGVGADGTPDFSFPLGLGTRVRHDYYRTLTDLFIEHLKVLDRWRRKRGMTALRHQAYGTTIDSSRAQGVVGIPDTETLEAGSPADPGSAQSQGALDFYRVAAGAAHIYGAREVNVEAGDVFGFGSCPKDVCVFGQQPSDYWEIINHAYAGGGTHVQIHGLSYREIPDPPRTSSWLGPQTWPWPGWSAMYNAFSEPWNRTWPQWSFWRPFTTYMGRASKVLSAGRPRVDLLVYRDNFLNGITGHPPNRRREALARAGYTYDFTDPVTLATKGSVRRRRLFPAGPAYKALIFDPANNWAEGMPGQTAASIARFARRGLPVVFVGELPKRGTSAADPSREDAQVRAAVVRMVRLRNVRHVPRAEQVGHALAALGVRPDAAWDRPALVHSVHRRTSRRDYFYLWNEGDRTVDFTASLATRGAPYEVDLWNNTTTPLARYRQRGATTRVPLRLGPHQATVVAVDRTRRAPLHVEATTADEVRVERGRFVFRAARAGIYRTVFSDGTRSTVRVRRSPRALEPSTWRLRVEEFSPSGSPRHELVLRELGDWQDIDELRNIAGTGFYTTTVSVPANWLRRGLATHLDLGAVHGASRVRVNGRLVTQSTIRLPGERHPVTRLLRPGENTIEVKVATPPLNKLRGLALTGDARYAPFLPLPPNKAGMTGPVRLIATREWRGP